MPKFSLCHGDMTRVECKGRALMCAHSGRRKCWEMNQEDAVLDIFMRCCYVSGVCYDMRCEDEPCERCVRKAKRMTGCM